MLCHSDKSLNNKPFHLATLWPRSSGLHHGKDHRKGERFKQQFQIAEIVTILQKFRTMIFIGTFFASCIIILLFFHPSNLFLNLGWIPHFSFPRLTHISTTANTTKYHHWPRLFKQWSLSCSFHNINMAPVLYLYDHIS